MWQPTNSTTLPEHISDEDVLQDYRLAYRSRQISLVARREVMNGRAKFGGFGDGKELPELAMARHFRHGDWRSGYYRDQTLLLALGEVSPRQFFAQLYGDADPERDPHSAGRQMPAHFATPVLNADGSWRDQTQQFNTSADLSPTAAQMPRLVGLAYASRLYRELESLHHLTHFSRKGDEIAFGIIGNASTAEGHFWEAVNAIAVLGAPAVLTILDDGYGISVSNEHAFPKENLSEVLRGFARDADNPRGYDVYTVPGWNYAALMQAYAEATRRARAEHVPALVHVTELTQPQGHSTSGSHERYKSAERLQWERDHDGLPHFRAWLLREEITGEDELKALETEEEAHVNEERRAAWEAFTSAIRNEGAAFRQHAAALAVRSQHADAIHEAIEQSETGTVPLRKNYLQAALRILALTRDESSPEREALAQWRRDYHAAGLGRYDGPLLSTGPQSPLHVTPVMPSYSTEPESIPGFQVLNRYFDAAFEREPRLITFGEDTGYLGGVNQVMAGLQAKYGPLRISDTGIRETTILGQAIGLALRGLRPIAEIQYLDYVLYALQTLSDDLASLRWRSVGRQTAPVIIRTRGHRLEGIWHAGSYLSGILNLTRGVHIVVPRDMTRAAGFYNTLLQGDDPALVVEVLVGYRKREAVPANLADIALPLGMPDILREGDDVTLVTYGALCDIALQAAEQLAALGIELEIIDVQTLAPFDIEHRILTSLQKTNRVLFVDEDVPGGATAYMLQQVIERQGGYHWLDSEPRTLSSAEHRPSYGTDGAYFSKPNAEDIVLTVYEMMNEARPARYPRFY